MPRQRLAARAHLKEFPDLVFEVHEDVSAPP